MLLRTKLKVVSLLIGTFVLAANLGFAQQPSNISADLQGLDPLTPVNVIVQFNSSPSLVTLETPLAGRSCEGHALIGQRRRRLAAARDSERSSRTARSRLHLAGPAQYAFARQLSRRS